MISDQQKQLKMKELFASMFLPPAQSQLKGRFEPDHKYQCYTDSQGMRILGVTSSVDPAIPVEVTVCNLKNETTLFYKLDKLTHPAPSKNQIEHTLLFVRDSILSYRLFLDAQTGKNSDEVRILSYSQAYPVKIAASCCPLSTMYSDSQYLYYVGGF